MDYLLGRPTVSFKRAQVAVTLAAAAGALTLCDSKTALRWRWLQRIDRLLAGLPPWKIVLGMFAFTYGLSNTFLLLFFNGLISRPAFQSRILQPKNHFHRAVWVMTALDAGFLTAMNVRSKILRDFLSVIFSLVYLLLAERGKNKRRKFLRNVTPEMIRVMWEKSSHPLFRLLSLSIMPRMGVTRTIMVPVNLDDSVTVTIECSFFYAGNEEQLAKKREILFHCPGGGFIAMKPCNHDEYLTMWSKKLDLPVISINYSKAPEHPYPRALNEVFGVYKALCQSKGELVGMQNAETLDLKIVLAGDSAGGNLVTGLTIKIIQTQQAEYDHQLVAPVGVHLIYPGLNFDIRYYMHHSHSKLLAAPGDIEARKHLRVDSHIQYISDSFLSHELVTAMPIMYLGEHPLETLNPRTDYLLSPIKASDEILARFPSVYAHCGSCDPLVDDAIVFVARCREVHGYSTDPLATNVDSLDKAILEADVTGKKPLFKIHLFEGLSHAYMHMMSVLPESWQAIELSAKWIGEILDRAK